MINLKSFLLFLLGIFSNFLSLHGQQFDYTPDGFVMTQGWRIMTPKAEIPVAWDVLELQFFEDVACNDDLIDPTLGIPVDSGNAGLGHGPEFAFNGILNGNVVWGGREDEDNQFWLGLTFNQNITVRCVKLYNSNEINRGASRVRIQALNHLDDWTDVTIPYDLDSSEGSINIMPLYSTTLSPTGGPTGTPTVIPSVSPTNAPTGSLTVIPSSPPSWTRFRIADATFTFSDLDNFENALKIEHTIGYGPDEVSVELMKKDCEEPAMVNDVVYIEESLISYNQTENLFEYYVGVDTTKIFNSSMVTFDPNFVESVGKIDFCVRVKTELTDQLNGDPDLVVRRREFNFTLNFDLTEKNFSSQFDLEDGPTVEIIGDIDDDFQVSVCQCNSTNSCLAEILTIQEEFPNVDICITPDSNKVSISNFRITFENEFFSYSSVIKGNSGWLIVNDELTDVVPDTTSGAVRVNTDLVANLFDDVDGDFTVRVFGNADLRFDETASKNFTQKVSTAEFEVEMVVKPAVETQPTEQPSTGCGNSRQGFIGRFIGHFID